MDKTAIKNYAVEARRKLIEAVKRKATTTDKKYSTQEIENVACTWFNRLIALRIMEVNEWLPSNIRILSSREEGRLEPEAIREIGRLDYINQQQASKMLFETDMNAADRLYRYVLIAQCKKLAAILPGIFKSVNDTSYDLLPDSLISKDGIVYDLVTKIDESNFDLSKQGQIEIIGWLYQFYISERKAEVFARPKSVGMKKDDIPAATQLFTPEWIVKYMVENSLGRLWLERKPNADLKAKWKYYLDEAEQEPEVDERLKAMRQESPIKSPEDITFIDPCMGSGHILVYAFEVLYQIYDSEGYAERDIPNLILEKNLHGLDIDDRATQLAYFALMMKARSKNRRFFRPRREEAIPQPMVYSAKGDSNLEEFGSLIKVEGLGEMPDDVQDLTNVNYMDSAARLNSWKFRRLLSQKYHVVVTNPPYMAPAPNQVDWVKTHYANSKSDLCVVFIERNFDLLKSNGYLSMVTMHSFMFLSSFAKFRKEILETKDIVNMAHLGARAFEEISDEVVQTSAFVKRHSDIQDYRSVYVRLVDFIGQQAKEDGFLTGNNRFHVKKKCFAKIPDTPIAYWLSDAMYSIFETSKPLSDIAKPRQGLATSDNDRFLKYWFEPSFASIGFDVTHIDDTRKYDSKWFPCTKGGSFRRWYGNNEYIVNWEKDGMEIKAYAAHLYRNHTRTIKNIPFYFQEGLSWSTIASGLFSLRYVPKGFIFETKGAMCFVAESQTNYLLALYNSKVMQEFLRVVSPTLDYHEGPLGKTPIIIDNDFPADSLVLENIKVTRNDWDSFETSWDFQRHPLLKVNKDTWWNESNIRKHRIEDSFNFWRFHTDSQFSKLKSNEEELNRIFIDIYGLQDELTPEVEDKDVTVRKADLGRDIRSFISYAVGCMFGRFSLDEPGLIFAGGNFDPSRYKAFAPVADNIIPIGAKDYFDNDIVVRFMEFVRTVYGEISLGENLNFITEALYPNANGTTNEKLRRYFLTDFYKDHLKTYQKRPIYWLLDSGKKNGFKALLYLHRYSKYTMGVARTDYLHAQIRKYEGELESQKDTISETSNARDKAALQKEASTVQAAFDECRAYDQILAHIAHQQIDLDLDDGVKVNYAKFQGVEVPKDGGGIEKMDLLGKI